MTFRPKLATLPAPQRKLWDELGCVPQTFIRLGIASLLDLAGTKVAVVQKRAEAKDYIDRKGLK